MWMASNGINIPEDVERDIVSHEQQGQTVVLAAINSMSARTTIREQSDLVHDVRRCTLL